MIAFFFLCRFGPEPGFIFRNVFIIFSARAHAGLQKAVLRVRARSKTKKKNKNNHGYRHQGH